MACIQTCKTNYGQIFSIGYLEESKLRKQETLKNRAISDLLINLTISFPLLCEIMNDEIFVENNW